MRDPKTTKEDVLWSRASTTNWRCRIDEAAANLLTSSDPTMMDVTPADPSSASSIHIGRTYSNRMDVLPTEYRYQPKTPTFRYIPARSIDPSVVASACASVSQWCKG